MKKSNEWPSIISFTNALAKFAGLDEELLGGGTIKRPIFKDRKSIASESHNSESSKSKSDRKPNKKRKVKYDSDLSEDGENIDYENKMTTRTRSSKKENNDSGSDIVSCKVEVNKKSKKAKKSNDTDNVIETVEYTSPKLKIKKKKKKSKINYSDSDSDFTNKNKETSKKKSTKKSKKSKKPPSDENSE